jgi:hypothetical protein
VFAKMAFSIILKSVKPVILTVLHVLDQKIHHALNALLLWKKTIALDFVNARMDL